MSEIKRAPLMSFGGEKADDKRNKPTAKSVRLSLALPESNESTCPIYNYREKLADAKKKEKSKHVDNGRSANTNGFDPFGDDDDDDVRRIAQEMEAKYGMGPTAAKKKRKVRWKDYADIGMGYDESDTFIDNTDGYDEIIPHNVTALYGGFYINSGALMFKTDEEISSDISSSSSSSSSSEDEEEKEKPSRKRVLATSESEGEAETEKVKDDKAEKKEKKSHLSNGAPVAKKKKLVIPDKFKNMKKTLAQDEPKKKTVKDLLKEKREVTGSNDGSPPETTQPSKVDKGDVMKENKRPLSTLSLDDIIESVATGSAADKKRLGGGEKEIVNKDVPDTTTTITTTTTTTSTTIPTTTTKNITQEKPNPIPEVENSIPNTNNSSTEQKVEIVQLPENLPDNILEIISKLKCDSASNIENNLKIFSSSVNTLLLSLERMCRCLGRQSKGKIYQHLGPFLKTKKDVLTKRAKMLLVEDESKKLALLVIKLKKKIDQTMPPLLDSYERESKKIVQRKFSKEGSEQEETKQLRMPKRKFVWSDEIKKLFKDIVTIRKRCLVLEGKTKEETDIQMNLYLKSDIQILWPDGWMSMTALLKIYNNFSDKKSPTAPPKLPSSKDIKVTDTTNNNPIKTSSHPVPNNNNKEPHTHKNNVVEKPPPVNSPEKEREKLIALGSKEIQKLANNSMLSITPVTPKNVPAADSMSPPVLAKNDLTINMIDNENRLPLPIDISKSSGISISPTQIPEKPKPDQLISKEEVITVIRPVKIETLMKPLTPEPPKLKEKITTFINLPQNSYNQKPEWTYNKPMKPPTDHKIENIIKPSKPENLSKPKHDAMEITPMPENLSKPKLESLSKPKPENLSKPKPENLSKPKHENPSKPKPENLTKPKTDKPESLPHKKIEQEDIIILDDSPKHEVVELPAEKQPELRKLIDLTSHASSSSSELKRKPGPKSKNKYYDPALIKPVKSASAIDIKNKISGNTPIDNILPENYFNNLKKQSEQKQTAPSSGTRPNDGDDIQKVMEDLKVLQKMSTPARNAEQVSGSPVSVISFNKSYTPKSSPSTVSLPQSTQNVVKDQKAEFGLGFQEAFQRQFLNELKNTLAVTQSGPTSSKNYNSGHSSSVQSHQEKYYMNANNNYAQQSASKYKTTYTPQQQGTYNLMDDMLANIMSEYAYPKAANHKPKPPQQK